jgi:hypothetical protein
MNKWFFSAGSDGTIHMQARCEDDAGNLGDAYDRVKPGESFDNISYAELLAAKSGVLTWDGARWHIG